MHPETAVVHHRQNVQRGHTHTPKKNPKKTIIRSDGIQKHRDLTAMENLITTLLRLATMTFRSAFFNAAFQHAAMQFSKKLMTDHQVMQPHLNTNSTVIFCK